MEDDDSHSLILRDIIGNDNSSRIDIDFRESTCVYSIGSLITIYNLHENNKQFITYHQSPIALVKLIKNKYLLSIDHSSQPLLVLWNLPGLDIALEFPIKTLGNFKVGSVYLQQSHNDRYLLLITSIDCNFLYELNFSNNNMTFGLVSSLQTERFAIGFGCFFTTNDLVIMLTETLEYHRIVTDQHQQLTTRFLFRINFPFKLQYDSLRISAAMNIVALLTEQGSCVLFDQSGNAKPSITPFKQEMFSCCEFSKDSLIVGTSNGKVYCYDIYDFQMRYYIDSVVSVERSKRVYGHDKEGTNVEGNGPRIAQMIIDENIDMIMLRSKDNSILLSSITSIMKETKRQFSFVSTGKMIDHFAFCHCDKITAIEFTNDEDGLVDFYTASYDQGLMFWRRSNNKWINTNVDISNIINPYGASINHTFNKTYLSVIKLHPKNKKRLFAGDNKGSLYVFNTNDQSFHYDKYIVGNYGIESLAFNPNGNLIAIGFDSGMIVICDLTNQCEFMLKIIDHCFNPGEIELRRLKGHAMSYSYFFNAYEEKYQSDSLMLYLKSHNEAQVTRLYPSPSTRGTPMLLSTIENTIQFPSDLLDIIIHTSEEYIIGLIKGNRIVVIQLSNNEVTAVIDLDDQASYCSSITLDPSGLFLGVVCSLRRDMEARATMIVFEVGTGNVKTCLSGVFEMSKGCFAGNGEEMVLCGANGYVSIWELPENMKNSIRNVLGEMMRNKLFWSQYEIKYTSDWEGKGLSGTVMSQGQKKENVMDMPIMKKADYRQKVFDEINQESIKMSKEMMVHMDKENVKEKGVNSTGVGVAMDEVINSDALLSQSHRNILSNPNMEEIGKKNVNSNIMLSQPMSSITSNNHFSSSRKETQNPKEEIQTFGNNNRYNPPPVNTSSNIKTNQIKPDINSFLSQRNAFDSNRLLVKQENHFEALSPKANQVNGPNGYNPSKQLIQSHPHHNQLKPLQIQQQPKIISPAIIIKDQLTKTSLPKRDTDFIINLNQDPNIFSSTQRNKQGNSLLVSNQHNAFPNIAQKAIVSSSTKQQNDIRLQNISKAVNDILLPQKRTKEEISIKKEDAADDGKKQRRKAEEIDRSVEVKRKDYVINNNPNKKMVYPEPEDIDDIACPPRRIIGKDDDDIDDLIPDSKNNNHYGKDLRNYNGNEGIPNPTENNLSMVNPISVTDDIDYLSDNIRNFEHNHKIK